MSENCYKLVAHFLCSDCNGTEVGVVVSCTYHKTIIIGICVEKPITEGECRDKATPLGSRQSYFVPVIHKKELYFHVYGGDAGYRPRVRHAYYTHVYVHSHTR